MKIYSKTLLGKHNKYGSVVFEWSEVSLSGSDVTKTCTQHSGQPAVFFEELLIEAGYKES